MLGMTEDEKGAYVLFMIVLTVVLVVLLLVRWRPRILRAGYPGLYAFLHCVPRTDAQKRDALDLTLRGLVLFIVGAVLQPLWVIGAFLFYYGIRKFCMIWMGLEILEGTDESPSESHGEPARSDATV